MQNEIFRQGWYRPCGDRTVGATDVMMRTVTKRRPSSHLPALSNLLKVSACVQGQAWRLLSNLESAALQPCRRMAFLHFDWIHR
jgi:hypothetical protein